MTEAPSRLRTPSLVTVCVTLLFGAMIPNIFVVAPRALSLLFDRQQIGVIMGAYQIAVLVVTPMVVPIATRIGFAALLAGGCLVAGAGAFWFAYADTLFTLTSARAVQGVGFAIVMVGAAAFVAETAPRNRLGEALGITGIVTLVAQALGPVVAEYMQQATSYRAAFLLGAAMGGAGAVAAWQLPAATARVISEPIWNRLRSAMPALLALGLSGVGFGAAWLFLADFAKRHDMTGIHTFFWPYVVAAVFSRVVLGKVSDRQGRHRVSWPALLGHAACFVALPLCSAGWHLIPVGLGYGLCHGIYYPALQALVVERADGPRGKAVAASTFAFGVGIIVAAYGLGPIALLGGYLAMYWISAAVAVVGAVLIVVDSR
jgi:MFS family permease